jgi:hypothetical protein
MMDRDGGPDKRSGAPCPENDRPRPGKARTREPATVAELAEAKALSEEFLREQGLRDLPGGGIAIPYYDADGKELFQRRRGAPSKDGRRFDQPRGVKLVPYGLWRLADLEDHPELYLTEGESDAWTLWQHGLPALALPGSNMAGRLQVEQLRGVTDLYLTPDNDQGGKTLTEGVGRRLGEIGYAGRAYVLHLPEGIKDVNELHCRGPKRFRKDLDGLRRYASDLAPPAPGPAPGLNGHGRPRAGQAPPETISAAELLTLELPEPRWAVPGLVPEGLSVFAGAPKLGKSWLALHMAMAVAAGGRVLGMEDAEAGDVLYLALEDTRRRLRDRLNRLRQRTPNLPLERLTLATRWPRHDQGGFQDLGRWLDGHPDARSIIIDTWAKYRPPSTSRGDRYDEDYRLAGELQGWAAGHNVALMAITHTRKAEATDPLEKVSGSVGLTGAADAVLVIQRYRGENEATLFTTGRDLDEGELALVWRQDDFVWELSADDAARRLSKARAEVVSLLEAEGKALTPAEAARLLAKERNPTKKLMWSMAKDGLLIAEEGGAYRLPQAVTSNHSYRGNSGNRGARDNRGENPQGGYRGYPASEGESNRPPEVEI